MSFPRALGGIHVSLLTQVGQNGAENVVIATPAEFWLRGTYSLSQTKGSCQWVWWKLVGVQNCKVGVAAVIASQEPSPFARALLSCS